MSAGVCCGCRGGRGRGRGCGRRGRGRGAGVRAARARGAVKHELLLPRDNAVAPGRRLAQGSFAALPARLDRLAASRGGRLAGAACTIEPPSRSLNKSDLQCKRPCSSPRSPCRSRRPPPVALGCSPSTPSFAPRSPGPDHEVLQRRRGSSALLLSVSLVSLHEYELELEASYKYRARQIWVASQFNGGGSEGVSGPTDTQRGGSTRRGPREGSGRRSF